MDNTTTFDQATWPKWVNWFGNQQFTPRSIEHVASEAAVQEAVLHAAKRGLPIRTFGGGHSLTPLVETEGVLLSISPLGDVTFDLSTKTAKVGGGHSVKSVADQLWQTGGALHNVGELDSATLIGATSTGVHGTGIGLPCLAANIRAARLVTANGSLLEITEADAELLRAVRISLGMLGVITEITVDALPKYDLRERSFFCQPDELAERWDEITGGNRHVSFFYLPDATAVEHYAGLVPQIAAALGAGSDRKLAVPASGEICLVTVRDIIDSGSGLQGHGVGQRSGRMDKILM